MLSKIYRSKPLFKDDQTSQPICLWCLKDVYHDTTVVKLFLKSTSLCEGCRVKLSVKWKVAQIHDLTVRYVSLYNQETADLIYRYKESLDEACYPIFFTQVQSKIKKRFQEYHVILMPSSIEKTKQRGFSHLQKMVEPLDLMVIQGVVWKTIDVKQATMSKENRSLIKESIEVDIKLLDHSMKILLIDDVCTTGQTLLAVFNMIKGHVKVIEAVVFAMHPECLIGGN